VKTYELEKVKYRQRELYQARRRFDRFIFEDYYEGFPDIKEILIVEDKDYGLQLMDIK
jgi:hypothetical protein